MATYLESVKAKENALKSPEAAAQYVHDQNQSTYVTDDEAKVAADALQKFAFTSSDASRLYDQWIKISNTKAPMLAISSSLPGSKAQKDRASLWGKVIYELATGRYSSGLSYSSDSQIPSSLRKFLPQTQIVLNREEKEKPVQYDPDIANQLSSIANNIAKSFSATVPNPASYKQMYVTADDVLIRKINKSKDKAGSLDRGAVVFYVKKSPDHAGYAEIMIVEGSASKPYLISEKYISDKQPAVKKLPSKKPKPPAPSSIDNNIQVPDEEFPIINATILLSALGLGYFAVKSIMKRD